jgi:hypothetical protein
MQLASFFHAGLVEFNMAKLVEPSGKYYKYLYEMQYKTMGEEILMTD